MKKQVALNPELITISKNDYDAYVLTTKVFNRIVDKYPFVLTEEKPTPDQRDMFTGGEWIASEVMNFSGTLVAFIKSSNGKEIAQLRGCETGEEKEAEANAALIAEAPAMYKALKDMIELAQDIKDQYSDLCDGENVEKHWQPRIDKAEAILNRIK